LRIPVELRSRLTVMVPTCSREESLARALSGLAQQRDPEVPWDVVVVDNAGSPGSEALAAAAAQSTRSREGQEVAADRANIL
jgi:GT2 family glycosyltransferase